MKTFLLSNTTHSPMYKINSILFRTSITYTGNELNKRPVQEFDFLTSENHF